LREGFTGVTFTPLTIDRGRRNGTRERIVETMRQCPDKLTVKLNALVTNVMMTGTRATGVEFLDRAHLYRADPKAPLAGDIEVPRRSVRARREVILAGGTFNTPQILMLSGIGPAAQLTALGIDPVVDLPDVGAHLQDRYEVGVVHEKAQPFHILRDAAFEAPKEGEPGDPEFQDWRDRRSGLYATNGATIAVIRRSRDSERNPDLYMFAVPGHFSGYRPGYAKRATERKNEFTWVILKGHTRTSGGYVRLRSRDPRDPPDINFKFFEESENSQGDLEGVVAGVEYIRSIAARTRHLIKETVPGKAFETREQIAQFVKDNAWGHHACGTCRIGRQGSSVLDSRFRVWGVTGLRVVDASVFPTIPGLFILSAVYMIAEKASDAILEDAQGA
jgi:choline dehydrogenase